MLYLRGLNPKTFDFQRDENKRSFWDANKSSEVWEKSFTFFKMIWKSSIYLEIFSVSLELCIWNLKHVTTVTESNAHLSVIVNKLVALDSCTTQLLFKYSFGILVLKPDPGTLSRISSWRLWVISKFTNWSKL